MKRITKVFDRRNVLVAFIMAGDPDLRRTEEYVLALEDGGADIIELGVPFSEPIADGPVIQRAGERSLRVGTTLAKILKIVSGLRQRTQVPIVLMGYYNPIFRYGADMFFENAAEAGVDGTIVCDLIPEEAGQFVAGARNCGLDTIFLLAPTSTLERIKRVVRVSSGFIYYVSLTGVTGARKKLSEGIGSMVKRIKKHTPLPVAVGFGISSSKQIREVWDVADGAVVGSAIVSMIEKGGKSLPRRIRNFVRNLK